jgi:ATP/maltotriose-dependent transcriptional regulator MalT
MLRYLAETALAAGDLERAGRALDDARRYVEGNPEEAYGAWVLLARARLLQARGDSDGAERAAGTALAEADRLGLRLLAAHCRAWLGRLAASRGDVGAARAAIAQAAAAFQLMGLDVHARAAQTELAQLP